MNTEFVKGINLKTGFRDIAASLRQKKDTWMLFGVSCLMGVVYFILQKLKGPNSLQDTTEMQLICMALLTASFVKGYFIIRSSRDISARFVFGIGLVLAYMALSIFPFNTDVWAYINFGWLEYHYHVNSYLHSVGGLPSFYWDPMFTNEWPNSTNFYGYLFTLLSRVLCALANGKVGMAVRLFQWVNFFAFVVTGISLWIAAKRLDFLKPAPTLYLYMWSPYVLLHLLTNLHNDILIAMFFVIGLALMIYRRWFWVVPALTASVLIKLTSAIAFPLMLIAMFRDAGWRKTLISSFAGGILFILVLLPYRESLFFIHLKKSLVLHSPHALSDHIVNFVAQNAVLFGFYQDVNIKYGWIDLSTAWLWRILFCIVLYLCWKTMREKSLSIQTLIERAVLVQLLLVVYVSPFFHPWHTGMFLPSAFLLKENHPLKNLVILLSCTQVFSLTFLWDMPEVHNLVVTLIPTLFYFAFYCRRTSLREVLPAEVQDRVLAP